MKILMINGSPRPDGNTALALKEMERVFQSHGLDCQTVHVGARDIRGCIACKSCRKTGKCVFDDTVNEIAPLFEACDALIIGSPVYYAGANGTLISFLNRLFYSTSFDKTMKVGAAVSVARRMGQTPTLDALYKYFTISGMPVASPHYGNGLYRAEKGEAPEDSEGLQTVRELAENTAFLVKSIALGKEAYGTPVKEPKVRTNFVR